MKGIETLWDTHLLAKSLNASLSVAAVASMRLFSCSTRMLSCFCRVAT